MGTLLHEFVESGTYGDGQSGTLAVDRKVIAVFRAGDEYFAIDCILSAPWA